MPLYLPLNKFRTCCLIAFVVDFEQVFFAGPVESWKFFLLFIALRTTPEKVDQRSSDMWSYAMMLWELATREVPYASLSPMECGMKVMIFII